MLLVLICAMTSSIVLPPTVSRRSLIVFSAATVATPSEAADTGDFKAVVLTEEEMAARVARKQALLRAQSSGGNYRSGMNDYVASDINPEAGVNLRSRSVMENAKASLAKQEELKNRSKKQKRDDLCEMLGRGC